jgi:hypothetical protein
MCSRKDRDLEEHGEYRRGAKRNAVRKWLKIEEKQYRKFPPRHPQELETSRDGNILGTSREPVVLDAAAPSLRHEISDMASPSLAAAPDDATTRRDARSEIDLVGPFATSSNAEI